MLRHALASLILTLSLACGPVAPAPTPDGAPLPPASTSTAEATTSTGGHSSGGGPPTSTGPDATGGSSTGAPDCAPLPCDDGCPAGSACLGSPSVCVEPTTGKPLCTSDGPCVDDNGTVTCV